MLSAAPADEPANDRWVLSDDGGIRTDLARLTRGSEHADHIEMAGRTVNAIVKWKVSAAGIVSLDRWVRWPMLREKPSRYCSTWRAESGTKLEKM